MTPSSLRTRVPHVLAAIGVLLSLGRVLGTSCPLACGADDARNDGVAPVLRDPNYDVVLGKVVSVVPPPPARPETGRPRRYGIEVLGDLRQKLAKHAVVTVVSEQGGGIKSAGSGGELRVAVGLPAVLLVRERVQPQGREWVLDPDALEPDAFPFGVEKRDPSIPAGDVAELLDAFRELRAAMSVRPGSRFPHARAVQLIGTDNFYLWALGTWWLAHAATREDVNLLTPDHPLPPRKALFLDYVFDHVTGPAADLGVLPSERERRRFLRESLEICARRRVLPPK